MPKVYFSTCYQLSDLKKKFKLKGSLQNEDEVLDAAIHSFFSLSDAKKIWALFKKRHLITPMQTSTLTPNVSPATKKGKPMDAPVDQELSERLFPKIFDDVQMKRWKDANGSIDMQIAI
jgi:hypothetical protein